MLLYPHLPHHVAAYLASAARRASIEEAASQARYEHSDCVFTPTGGNKIDTEKLRELRQLLLEQAEAGGYPNPPTGEQRTQFDMLTAVALHTRMQIAPSEAAKRGVWEFISCVLAPDIVRWRFTGDEQGSPLERFLAGRRNTFQRLWWRAQVFKDPLREDNPYAALKLLGEDELVQIMERPNLAASRALTRHIVNGLISANQRYPQLPRRLLIREGQKRVMRLSSFLAFDAVEDEDLARTSWHVFEAVAANAERQRSEGA